MQPLNVFIVVCSNGEVKVQAFSKETAIAIRKKTTFKQHKRTEVSKDCFHVLQSERKIIKL